MDNINHPILQEAIEKRDQALEEAKRWDRFVEDYQRLAGNKPAVKAVKATKDISWAKMRELFDKILQEKQTVENAAQFEKEFAILGYHVPKEKISSCLTHAKTNFHKLGYDKDKGGWFLIKENLLKAA